MLYLSKFYPLLHKSVNVVLYDADTCDFLYEGMLKNIPDEYDEATVADFCWTDNAILFYIKKED